MHTLGYAYIHLSLARFGVLIHGQQATPAIALTLVLTMFTLVLTLVLTPALTRRPPWDTAGTLDP